MIPALFVIEMGSAAALYALLQIQFNQSIRKRAAAKKVVRMGHPIPYDCVISCPTLRID